MIESEAWQLLAGADVAILGTRAADGTADLVPIVVVVVRPLLYFAIDDVKPKRTLEVARLANIARNPSVTVLAHHYEADWSRLWWVRAKGRAVVCTGTPEADQAITRLAARYPQYGARPPTGGVVRVTVEAIRGWSAAA